MIAAMVTINQMDTANNILARSNQVNTHKALRLAMTNSNTIRYTFKINISNFVYLISPIPSDLT